MRLIRRCTDSSRYPPDRQIIYLDVARPRGLIVIEKASKEEGRLSDQVREWIKDNLELRAEVPGLELLDDGNVMGGSLDDDGQDVLLHQQSLKSKPPRVLIGPDSTPTLSFTSGSEGRPKGVCGRHFSLTHYYPWMADTFGLNHDDQFTMLSGIAVRTSPAVYAVVHDSRKPRNIVSENPCSPCKH